MEIRTCRTGWRLGPVGKERSGPVVQDGVQDL